MSKLQSGRECDSYTNSGKILSSYFDSLEKVGSVISKEDEFALFERYIASGKKDIKIRDEIFLANVSYVVSVAKKYASYGFPLIDLIQEGNIGMLEAIERFDFEKVNQNGGRLISFAHHRIMLHLAAYIKRNLKMTNFGRSNDRDKLFFRLPSYISPDVKTLTPELLNKICTELEVSEKDVIEMYNYMNPLSHVTSTVKGEDGEEYDITDTIINEDSNTELLYGDYRHHLEMKRAISIAMSDLTAEEMYIMENRTMPIEGQKPATLSKLATDMGVSREWVRVMENKMIEKMRKKLLNNSIDPTSLFK